MQNTSIRSCLEWCVNELYRRRPSAELILKLDFGSLNSLYMEHLAICAQLWQNWRRQDLSPSNSKAISWADQAEVTMGVSPTELLATISVMILNIAHIEIFLGQLPKREPLLSRALTGAESLLKCQDWELANYFITAHCYLNTVTHVESTPGGYAHRQGSYHTPFGSLFRSQAYNYACDRGSKVDTFWKLCQQLQYGPFLHAGFIGISSGISSFRAVVARVE
jgi:hypothetical protein